MIVLKFGGTSIANAENIKRVRDIVLSKSGEGKTVVVVSALGGVTDELLLCGQLAASGDPLYREKLESLQQRHLTTVKELLPLNRQSALLSHVVQQFNELEDLCNGICLLNDFTERTRGRLLAYGELISSQIVAGYFNAEGTKAVWTDARKLIKTDSQYTKAAVLMDECFPGIEAHFTGAEEGLFIVPGFVAADANGHTTTLGRGGSDYTAALLGAALGASAVEIWTDVSGMMTADPRAVANAKSIPKITYSEAMELSHFGAKVIYPPTIQPLMIRNIPVWIRNTFLPNDEGTIIHSDLQRNGDIITGISSIRRIALLSLEGSGMIGIPGFSKRFFEVLATHGINVILITQASSEHSICVGVEAASAAQARQAVNAAFAYEIEKGLLQQLSVESDLSIVALVGDKMKSHSGISGRMFSALGRNGVNIRAIAQGSSERNISAVITTADLQKALVVLHEEFFEKASKQVNVFITGAGNVGGRLLAQLAGQAAYLKEHLRLQVRVIGLSNSRKMVFNDEGIDLGNWKEILDGGETADINSFISVMQRKNLPNSVFVDVTANGAVAALYHRIFSKSVSIVACNKIACSSEYAYYNKLKQLATDHNVGFLFETNVGASLPIIGTINDLLRSGDTVKRMQAVLSGTLNFVFNQYDGTTSFASVVRRAQEEGYTEPDPRLDLSGKDVMRKILILAREAGASLEMEDISNHSFMPERCMQGSVEDFYREMEKEEPYFRSLYEDAAAKGCKLKFVASYDEGRAKVGLQQIEPGHDFFHLYGKDNIVLFYTSRYVDQPLVIKGAGAGADVTASGIFADIIRTARV